MHTPAPAGRPSWVSIQLHAALANADRPLRARSLAYDLGLTSAEVTAELRRLQDLGIATSRDRRWSMAQAEPVDQGDTTVSASKSA